MIDLVSLCNDRGIDLIEEGHHHCHDGWMQLDCPLCGYEGGFHLGFNLEYGNFSCWRCGKHSAWEIITALFPNDNPKAIFAQYSIGHYKIPKRKPKTNKKLVWPNFLEDSINVRHAWYLQKRNFNALNLQKQWNLKGTSFLSGEWNWRIIAPIKNRLGYDVSYAGRRISKERNKRWKLLEEEKVIGRADELIYGIEKVKDTVIICEGPTDVWRIGPGAVGLFGIKWTEAQANILRTIPNRIIMFDREKIAEKQAEKLANWLAPFPGKTSIFSDYDADDPGELPEEEVRKIRKKLFRT